MPYAFYIAGGTALALQIGHRLSNDLDFFGDAGLEEWSLWVILKKCGPAANASDVDSGRMDDINHRSKSNPLIV